MGTWLDVPPNYALCIEAFGKSLDIFPNTLELEVGDGCCMIVDGEEKYLKVLSIQSNEQKAKYLAKQLIHPTNEPFDSELFESLNNKRKNCGTSAFNNPLEYITQLQNIRKNNAETQTESCGIRHCEVQTDNARAKMKEVGTQINEYELSPDKKNRASKSTNRSPLSYENHNDLLEDCTSVITNEQISALAECLSGIPNGHVYFFLYMSKRLLPNSSGEDVNRVMKWIHERQRLHFPKR